MKGEIVGTIDVAQVTIYLFWIFFVGLVVYLRREDRREGYPLFSEPSNTYKSGDTFFIPPPKVFRLPHGGTRLQAGLPPGDSLPEARPRGASTSREGAPQPIRQPAGPVPLLPIALGGARRRPVSCRH